MTHSCGVYNRQKESMAVGVGSVAPGWDSGQAGIERLLGAGHVLFLILCRLRAGFGL